MFYEEGNTASWASWTVISNSIITLDFEGNLFVKERLLRAMMSIEFSLRYNSISLRFLSDTLAIPKHDV